MIKWVQSNDDELGPNVITHNLVWQPRHVMNIYVVNAYRIGAKEGGEGRLPVGEEIIHTSIY